MRSDIKSFLTRSGILCLIFFCLFMARTASGLAFQAEEEVRPRLAAFSRPDPEGVPTKVEVGGYLMDLSEVNDVNQTFSADLYMWYTWHDLCLRGYLASLYPDI